MTAAGRLPRVIAVSIGFAVMLASPAHAQGSGDAAGLQSGTSEESSAGSTVQVGAGTAAGVTTGDSGEAAASSEGEAAGGGGPPPLPSADLCDGYENEAAHAACLETVLLEENGGNQ